ncbi:MAG TPA: L-seryl-tRNA(Sec) selenium transferase [Candidatus Sulfotelmatobacter sp.]|nr:L-seryl-tRNA(Sec) selenium transferase [Candidatus Sulfotelmatobacter sp.]
MRSLTRSELFRRLPSVDEVIRRPSLTPFVEQHGQVAVTDAVRVVLTRLREEINSGLLDDSRIQLALDQLSNAINKQLRRSMATSLRPVINATGVILHTNLGRAPLAPAALDQIGHAAAGYSNLEFDIEAGERGKRDVHVDRLFAKLLADVVPRSATMRQGAAGKISTIVVNNNAAAVLLALNTLAEGGEVVVSRGELVEIGGSFRIPDVMAKSGAVLCEVGTTNRTRLADYEKAINERTRALLRVHRSNFQITGFTEQPSVDELADLARKRNIPLIEDLGSGSLVDLGNFGVSGEPSVLDSLTSGVEVVTYSGDKLLGGPQAGVISGSSDLIGRMRKNSLYRALRVDKLIYAALEATLIAYVKHDYDAIPTLRMLRFGSEEIAIRAEALAAKLAEGKWNTEVMDGESVIGGGAAPSSTLRTRLLALESAEFSAEELSTRLRHCDPPIIARVEGGRVLLDLRTVLPEQDQIIAAALHSIA